MSDLTLQDTSSDDRLYRISKNVAIAAAPISVVSAMISAFPVSILASAISVAIATYVGNTRR